MEEFGVIYFVVGLFLFILVILWILLPLAIFGIKDKLEQLVAEMQRTNYALVRLVESMAAERSDDGKKKSSD